MATRFLVLTILTVLILAAAGCGGSTNDQRTGPTAAKLGLDAEGRMQPGPDDRCPVCAMTTHDRKMGSAIELEDGRTFYTCGTGCMLKCWLHPEVYLGAGEIGVKRAVTTEFFTGQHVDATSVVWVAGSDVVGPMGPMIVPLADESAAASFRERHGGTNTFGLDELDDAGWEAMTGKKVIPDARP